NAVPSAKSAAGTLTIVTAASAVAIEAQTPNKDQNTYNVPYNTEAGPFTLLLVDAAGNPTVYPGPILLTAAQVAQLISPNAAGINGLRLSLAGADLQMVTIPAGTSSLAVYVAAASGSYTPAAPRLLASILPTVAINDPGALGDASVTSGFSVTGSAASPQSGDSLNNVTVTMTDTNGTSINGAVTGTSSWSAYFSAADVARLSDSTVTVTAGASTLLGNSAPRATVTEPKSTQLPVLVSAVTTSANTVALTYSKPLAPASFLAGAANGFSLNDGGTLLPVTAALSAADSSNKTVILTLPVPFTIAHGDSITVSYVQGNGAAVASAVGNLVMGVSNQFVLNGN
ncbi:MAG: putative flagellar system-associated repeat, partial [Bacilli bacterium]|nr:putative flagellar system-associated repeat [Bacilli bacterium]